MKIIEQYEVLSPDGFAIEMDSNYKTIEQAEIALDNFIKRYEQQGYYSTIKNGERYRIQLHEIKENCQIKKI